MTERSLLLSWRGRGGADVNIGLGHGQALDLETLGRLDQGAEVLLANGDLAPVHVDQELLHVTAGHPTQVDDVVLLLVPVLSQQRPEVGAAHGEHQAVGGEQLLVLGRAARQGHVRQLLPHDELLDQQEEALVVVVPFQKKFVLG